MPDPRYDGSFDAPMLVDRPKCCECEQVADHRNHHSLNLNGHFFNATGKPLLREEAVVVARQPELAPRSVLVAPRVAARPEPASESVAVATLPPEIKPAVEPEIDPELSTEQARPAPQSTSLSPNLWHGSFDYICWGCEYDGNVTASGSKDLAREIRQLHEEQHAERGTACSGIDITIHLSVDASYGLRRRVVGEERGVSAPKANGRIHLVHTDFGFDHLYCSTLLSWPERRAVLRRTLDPDEVTCRTCIKQMEYWQDRGSARVEIEDDISAESN